MNFKGKRKSFGSRILIIALALIIAVPVGGGAVLAAPTAPPAEDPLGYQPMLKTWYTAPSSDWENESMPLGNGFIGASVMGGVNSERVLINDHTLWSGGPGANANYNGGFSNSTQAQNVSWLRQAQEALQAAWKTITPSYVNDQGRVVGATTPSNLSSITTNYINNLKGNKGNFGAYQQLSNLIIATPAADKPKAVNISANFEHPNNAGERSPYLFDGLTGTKAYADNFTPPCTEANPYVVNWAYDTAFRAEKYRLASGNDMRDRDFLNWKLYASTEAEGDTFNLVDTVTGAQFPSRQQYQTFDLDVPGQYRRFRMEVTALRTNNNKPQMSEIEVLDVNAAEDVPFSDYRRELDLDNSIARVEYTQQGVRYGREYFVSFPNNFMGIRLTANTPGSITKKISIGTSQARSSITSTGDTITLTGRPNDHSRSDWNFSNTLNFAQQVKVVPEGGTLTTNADGSITVTGADAVVLLTTTDTNYVQSMDDQYQYFDGKDPLNDVKDRIAAVADEAFDDLYAAHRTDYKALFDRVKLNLNNVPFPAGKTTVQLLSGYKSNSLTDGERRYLETLYYQFGRYLLISSSRPGSLPANLQGIWAEGLSPPWSADYHTNINLQMNYWPAEQTNLSETAEPVIDYVQSLVPRGTFGARRIFGEDTRGWTIWHENNIWGNAGPATSDAFFSPEDGAWMAQHIWEHYLFTKDEAFLQANYNLLRDAALFWVDTLWTDERDGKLVANPSYSPEHGPYSLGATEVQAVIDGIFDQVIKASEILGINTPELAEIKTAKDGLLGPKIGLGGQFQEWRDEIAIDLTGDGGHRHTNHLYGLHPGDQIVAGRSEQEDAYVEAMKKTLNTRGDASTGWSMGWKLNFWARVRDGNRAHTLFRTLLTNGTLNNLWDTHSPFQIDGNFGGVSGVTEMLIQSQGGMIELLPAMSDQWHTGAVKGLKARGNVEVDMAWRQATLSKAVLKPVVSNPGMIVRGDNISTSDVTDKDGEKVDFTIVDKNTIRFDGTAGQVYTIDNIRDAEGEQAAKESLGATIEEAKEKLSEKPVTFEYYDRKANGELEAALAVAEAVYTDGAAGKFDLQEADVNLKAAITVFDNRYNMKIEIDLKSGVYNTQQKAVIQCASDLVEIHYTLDGSIPTMDSPLYNTSINLPFGTSRLRASAFFDGVRVGDSVSASYFCAWGTNLARSKTITASQAISGYGAGNMVDGNYNNRWASNGNNRTVTIDFGAPTAIDNLTIVEFAEDNQGSRINQLTVETSDDGAAWAANRIYNRNNMDPRDFLELLKSSQHTWIGIQLEKGTTARYLRLTFNAGDASVWEIEAHKDASALATTKLYQAIAEADTLFANSINLYRDGENKTAFLSAREAGKSVYAAPETQEAVDHAAAAIIQAINGLERKDARLAQAVRDATMIVTDDFESGAALDDFAAARTAGSALLDQADPPAQEAYDTAAQTLRDAMNALVRKVASDKTALQAALLDAEAVTPSAFLTDEYRLNFAEAVAKAINAERRVSSDQATVDGALAELNLSMHIHFFPQTIYGAFKEVFEGTGNFRNEIIDQDRVGDYISSSWADLTEAFELSEHVMDMYPQPIMEVNRAKAILVDALANLRAKASEGALTLLTLLVEMAEAVDQAQFTPASVEPFADALAEAIAILADPENYTDDDIYAAAEALITAQEALVAAADKTSLKAAIDYAIDLLKNESKYIPIAVENLKDALADAQAVYVLDAATQEAVDQSFDQLSLAISKILEKGDKKALQALYTLTGLYQSANYTKDSWDAFKAAYDAAKAVLDNPNAVKEHVDKAYADLSSAMSGLKRKADFAALNAAIKSAQNIVDHIDDYVASTVTGLPAGLESAKAVAENSNATQAQVNAAATALNTLILTARLKPDLSLLTKALKLAGTLKISGYTEASAAVLTKAIQEGTALVKNPAKAESQTVVDQASGRIYEAIKGLIPAAKSAADSKKDKEKAANVVSSGGSTPAATGNEKAAAFQPNVINSGGQGAAPTGRESAPAPADPAGRDTIGAAVSGLIGQATSGAQGVTLRDVQPPAASPEQGSGRNQSGSILLITLIALLAVLAGSGWAVALRRRRRAAEGSAKQ